MHTLRCRVCIDTRLFSNQKELDHIKQRYESNINFYLLCLSILSWSLGSAIVESVVRLGCDESMPPPPDDGQRKRLPFLKNRARESTAIENENSIRNMLNSVCLIIVLSVTFAAGYLSNQRVSAKAKDPLPTNSNVV